MVDKQHEQLDRDRDVTRCIYDHVPIDRVDREYHAIVFLLIELIGNIMRSGSPNEK